MNEVACTNVALLRDSLSRHGFDPDRIWAGLPVGPSANVDPKLRIDWDLWVSLMDRVDAACGSSVPMEQIFVQGAGVRTSHPFVRIGAGMVSLRALYGSFARFGLQHTMSMQAAVSDPAPGVVEVDVWLDPGRRASAATFRFLAGVLRSLPTLQGLAPAGITPLSVTGHRARYSVVLPAEAPFWRRWWRAIAPGGSTVAAIEQLDELSSDLLAQNRALSEKVIELRRASAEISRRDEWLGLALRAARVGTWSVADGSAEPDAITAHLLGVSEGRQGLDAALVRVFAEDRDRVRAAVRSALAGDVREVEIEIRVERGDGPAWARLEGRRHVDDAGNVLVIGVALDVSRRMQVESQLRLADRLLSTGTLAAGVAHEVSNPLTAVLTHVDLLWMDLGQRPELREVLEVPLTEIRGGLERIRTVVRDLQMFSTPDAGTSELVDATQVCESTARLFRPQLSRANLRIEAPVALPPIRGSASRLGQVVLNLLTNARHALGDGGTVVVRIRHSGDDVVIEVVDDGVGIPDDVLPRVFAPFFTTRTAGEGSGLGLAICRDLVTQMGGSITVESAVGVGTTFRVTLPVATARPTRRVLVVDDEGMIRRVFAAILERQGYDVATAEGGAAAMASAGPFDAVVCDLRMPDADGEKVYADLTARWPHLAGRFVFVSGGVTEGGGLGFPAHEHVRLLAKPVRSDQLLEAVADACARGA